MLSTNLIKMYRVTRNILTRSTKLHKKRIFLSSGLLSSQCQSMYRYINNTACACPILFLWSRDDLDRFIRFWAWNIALLEFRLVHSIHWGAARLISFLDHLLRSVPQNRDLVQNTVFNFIASAVDELTLRRNWMLVSEYFNSSRILGNFLNLKLLLFAWIFRTGCLTY